MSKKNKVLVLEATDSDEESASFVWDDQALIISVTEEQAVDSYNAEFECTLTATPEQARQLRDWLNGLALG